jgi:hypothetical protein
MTLSSPATIARKQTPIVNSLPHADNRVANSDQLTQPVFEIDSDVTALRSLVDQVNRDPDPVARQRSGRPGPCEMGS